LFDNFLFNALGGAAAGNAPNVNWADDVIRCTLHGMLYAPSKTAHDYVDDLTNEVAAGGAYATGGVALTTKTIAVTGSVIKLDADDAVWAASTITAEVAVVSDRTPATAATQPLISYHDNAAPVSSIGGEFRVQWAAAGIVSITIGAEA